MALPSGYKQLEYIESSGTQYIDTEYYPRWNTRIVDEIKMAAYSGTKAAFGTRNANSATASKAFAVFQTGANTFRVDYFGSSKTITLDVSTDQKLTIDMNKNVCVIGGKTATNTAVTSGEATYTLMLFTYSSSGKAGSLSSMRRYSTKVYEGDVLVRHYIPSETSGGEVGLWEDVQGVFRGNDGTGTFSAGPEVNTDPMAPHSGHNTNIGNAAREIEAGTTLIGGVSREIESGTVLINGVVREIEFAGKSYDVTVEWFDSSNTNTNYWSVTVGGVAVSVGNTLTVDRGTEVVCTVKTANTTEADAKIYMNGAEVAGGGGTYSYRFEVTGPVTIQAYTNRGQYGFTGGYLYITME